MCVSKPMCSCQLDQFHGVIRDIFILHLRIVTWRRSIMVLRLSRKQKVLGSIPSVAFLHSFPLFGLLAVNQMAAWHAHSLKREMWGLSRFGLMPRRVERGVERE